MVNGRNKGASFEREVGKLLEDELGISFKRDLEQYRAADHGDLLASDPDFPFVIECKRYASGTGCTEAWRAQATCAAIAQRKIPAVVFKFDRRAVRVAVPFAAIARAFGGTTPVHDWAEITLDGLAFLAREMLADPAAKEN